MSASNERIVAVKQISFGDYGDIELVVAARDNDGRTEGFTRGEQIKLRLYAVPSSILSDTYVVGCSHGSVTLLSTIETATFKEEEYDDDDTTQDGIAAYPVIFVNGEANLPLAPETITVEEWYGNDLGTPSIDKGAGQSTKITVDNDSSNYYGMGAARIQYTARYRQLIFNSDAAGDYELADIYVIKADTI
jgi:hypothetical protein